MEQPKSIIIAHHNNLVRHNIVDVLGRTSDLVIIGQCAEILEALEMIRSRRPDFAIVELSLPEVDDIEFIRKVRNRRAHLRLIVITEYEDEKTVIRTLRAGANGYMLKSEPVDALLTAIRFILKGNTYVSEPVRHRMLEAIQQRQAQAGA
jgi:DNA-binding NarL/FixJ family response regulator